MKIITKLSASEVTDGADMPAPVRPTGFSVNSRSKNLWVQGDFIVVSNSSGAAIKVAKSAFFDLAEEIEPALKSSDQSRG